MAKGRLCEYQLCDSVDITLTRQINKLFAIVMNKEVVICR